MVNEVAVRKLKEAIYSRQRAVSLEHCAVGSFNNIFDAVVDEDPRIIMFIELEKLQYNYSKKSILSINEDYVVSIEYNPNFAKINEVVLYDGTKTALQILNSRGKNDVVVVGKNIDNFLKEMDSVYSTYIDTLEGFNQLYWETMTYRDYTIANIHVQFSLDYMQLHGIKKRVEFEIKRIVAEMRNVSKIPVFLKVFLAFSYVSQNCSFNKNAQQEKLHHGEISKFPNAAIAYGVINDKSAASLGIAWMLKHLLDEMGIENILISGKIEDSFLHSDNYFWNMVKIDGMYYHIDASWNIDMAGIFVGGFMKDDAFMSYTHLWYEHYPNAKGTRFDYDYVEDYLLENGEELLDMGLPDYLLFPEPVNDF